MTNEVEASLAQSFGEVLVRLAGERPGLLVVSGPDTSLVSWFTQIWPERLVTVDPAASRLSVGQGIRRGGGEAIVVLDETVSVLPSVMTAPMVLLSADRMHLGAAHRAGTTVCQPGWELDLPALLIGALGADEPVVLHLPEPLPGLPEQPDPERTSFGDPRVLHRGRRGLVIGAGPTAPVAAWVARRLAGQQVDVLALDSHTMGADSGVDTELLADHLLVGPIDAPRAGALDAVRVDPSDLHGLVNAVRRALPGMARS